MGPTWGRQDPGGSHVGHMNLAIWGMWAQTYEQRGDEALCQWSIIPWCNINDKQQNPFSNLLDLIFSCQHAFTIYQERFGSGYCQTVLCLDKFCKIISFVIMILHKVRYGYVSWQSNFAHLMKNNIQRTHYHVTIVSKSQWDNTKHHHNYLKIIVQSSWFGDVYME